MQVAQLQPRTLSLPQKSRKYRFSHKKNSKPFVPLADFTKQAGVIDVEFEEVAGQTNMGSEGFWNLDEFENWLSAYRQVIFPQFLFKKRFLSVYL